ncbi:MAG: TonB-dependent receptor plug domain-containing protein [Flavobacteriales bacterium]|nr:TonB-dependent receptor plug domain-containing protein [Flavobacteriia bacterium]NCP05005.1 TonB-dependent receptor plug domain-containing protein [Flavobacteriales bacterium]PIV94216.1 MAG: TonB-dependent receptor [Flavobacteriaceae bacterium CG17_big_fil_post_rev_8_21_14_2_50_33_15]PIY11332.1 MAG: TonB-dependent receptor [Flavobacteriaceae bacterium CG_4_10_14_3_um_filter_33_47]PJB19391.1 MAG: TonB-dependent receptor [Flavobacteriaceae bacterium CG_4_9_14_3_um_filter_33_16]
MISIGYSQTATIKGIILDENKLPISNVNIKASTTGTITNDNGFYVLKIPANDTISLEFTHISHKKVKSTFSLKNGETYEFNPVMSILVEQIATIIISGKNQKNVQGILTLNPETIRKIPGANAGVENLLMSLPGVSNNNELSTQYAVRGGNYDENLVYVNGIEIYRPFLIRSGQQEGLSFVNTDLVQNVDFSAGGFQAKYGDKLSSVLDITYKNPYQFESNLDLSLLGGSVSVEGVSKDSKLSGIMGLRYRDNSLLVNAKETQTNYDPLFADLQTFLTYKFTDKFHLSFLGNASLNKYNYEPETRQTNFGTLSDPLALIIFYEGQEKDQYQTLFGAFKGTYFANDDLTLQLIASTYHTTEEEYFDILAQYNLGEVNANIGDENLGEVEFSEGIGSQLIHGRNDLDALITNIEHKGTYSFNDHQIEWSVKYTHEDIRDRLVEWEIIDSAGFSINPPNLDFSNEQPYAPYEGPLVAFQNVRATNKAQINRLQAYAQWSKRSTMGSSDVWYNAGVRVHNWSVSGDASSTPGTNIASSNQTVFSPRAQFAIKPNWVKDMLFRIAAGLYYQPPFYKELRDATATVQPNVKAQQSFHLVLGNDYSFKMWNRPFKLTTEAYYKNLTNVNPYTLENVRIRYRANNNAKAYAYGLDMRLNGEFVPGTESWFSFGYLKTEENIDNRGYIARPTDQRLKFAALFQDYVPNIPNMKMYLNLVYNTGLPGGSPSNADPYEFQNRLPAYKRADLGLQFVLVDEKKPFKSGWKKPFKALSFGFEIFNMFDVQNSITNTWVRDVNSKRQYAIPNFLTPRVFNVRTTMKF